MVKIEDRGLLSLGVFLIIIVISILFYTPLQIITDWTLTFALILVLSGAWFALLAAIRASQPQKYERGPFSTLATGLLLLAMGGAWFLYGYNWLFSLILVLVVLALLAIAAALTWK
jgi:hypothetical protein